MDTRGKQQARTTVSRPSRRTAGISPATKKRTHQSSPKNNRIIEIRLALPQWPKQLPKLPNAATLSATLKRQSKRRSALLGVAVLFLILIFILPIVNGSKRAAEANETGVVDPLERLERGDPDYSTLLPKDTSIKELGGWTRVSPSDREPVYAYTDTIGNIPISVSQQPLPEDFKEDPTGKVKSVANSFGATEKVQVGGTTVYIGSSSNGPQSIIFQKDGLLILIKSVAPIKTPQWRDYIGSLR